MVISQIEERQRARQLDDERRQKETEAIVMQMKEEEAKDILAREKKIVANRKRNEEVLIANKEQEKAKLLRKEQERLEDLAIADYVTKREAKEEQRDKELAAIRLAKELETIKLRSLQEKSLDLQSQRDELRAKRHQETLDRQWREKELEEARKQKQLNVTLKEAREAQQREKTAMLREKQIRDRQQYLEAQAQQDALAGMEELEHAQLASRQKQQREDILSQIAHKEKLRAEERRRLLEEGKAVQADLAYEKELVTAIRAQKLQEMEALGVPENYRGSLMRKKVMETSYARDSRK